MSQTNQEPFPERFHKTWQVLADTNRRYGTVTIEPQDNGTHRITYSKREGFAQILKWEPEARTLVTASTEDAEQRSVSLWTSGGKDYIYAMYHRTGAGPSELPFEKGEHGTWGAEDG